jgi:two-component system, NtrC family, sensor kinase
MSLRAKLLLVTTLLSLVPLGVVSVLGLRYFRADKEAFIFALGAQVAPVVAGQIESNVDRVAGRLVDAARLATSETLRGGERAHVASEIIAGGDFLAVTIRAGRHEVLSWNDASALPRGDDAQAVLDALRIPDPPPAAGEVSVANATRLPSTPVALVVVALPVAGGGPPVTAAGLVPTRRIFQPGLASAYHTYVVDGQGRVLVHPDGQLVAARTDLSHLAPVEQVRSNATGARRYVDFDGKEVLGAFAPVAGTGLGIIQEIPAEAVFGAIRALFANVAIALGIVLIGALVAAFVVSGGVSRPVSQLAQVAKGIGQGKLDTPVPDLGGGEMGELAEAFRSMQRGLAERDARLREAQEALVQSEKMGALGQLAAGITHEVKNPMSGIIGFAQLCLKIAPEESPLRPHLSMIEKESKRAKDILENLLRFSRKEKMEMERCDPVQVVDEAIKLMAHQLQINKVQLVRKAQDDVPAIMGNMNQLQQVLMNLMMNAAHAMQPKGGRLEVATQRAQSGHVVIEVKDEGHGIKDADRKKLFTPFFTTKEKGKGTGLGLSVSYGIVKQHQGDVKVWSQEGVGTIFYVYLPPYDSFKVDVQAA